MFNNKCIDAFNLLSWKYRQRLCGEDVVAYGFIHELIGRETPLEPLWIQDYSTNKESYHPICQKCKEPLSNNIEFFHRCRNTQCEQLVDWNKKERG